DSHRRAATKEGPGMSIAAAVFLAAVGAILYFAVDEEIAGIDLNTVGIILMGAGAVGLLLTMLMQFASRSRRTERVVEREGRPVEREDIRERY
ncbi:MAG: DUF6458 family protein, partial [Actinomycetota bacterium]|nr:DUF6458 family protein [Actinomycetota bacterium]